MPSRHNLPRKKRNAATAKKRVEASFLRRKKKAKRLAKAEAKAAETK
jgi:hypothetical protein